MENKDLTITESIKGQLQDAREQVNMIQYLMKDIMKDKQHYGKIPGCGDKNCLLKAGAEKLCLAFKLRMVIDPIKDITITDLGEGHREYRIVCHLYNMKGEEQATGLGSCSTREGKYAVRFGHPNPNIADTYNTVLKMAKKRAHVDASITACAASDIFTQDIEEMDGIGRPEAQEAEVVEDTAKATASEKQKAEEPKQPVLAVMDWSFVDKVETVKNIKNNKKGFMAVFGDLKMYGQSEEHYNTLADACKDKKQVKIQFDNSGAYKRVVNIKVK